jgi:2-deoxy-D-gluconate 3-dehydrogenase
MKAKFDGLFSIKGKVALVTGGSRGIGEMIAAGFLANGAKVYISSRKAAACAATAERLGKEYGRTCIALPADLSQLSGVEGLAQRLGELEESLDILINNAGAAWGAPIDTFPEAGWDKVMNTNVKAVFFLTQKLLPLLRHGASAASPARVVNIGSIDGIKTAAFSAPSYGASKAAVHHLTRFLASQLVREHIFVNAIAPGPFPTWMLSTGVGSAAIPKTQIGRSLEPTIRAGALGPQRTLLALLFFSAPGLANM